MSETILKIWLSELTLVRVHCQREGCGAVVEVPVAELTHKFPGGTCPFCHQRFFPAEFSMFELLASLVETQRQQNDRVKLEFVLPAKQG